MLKLRIGPHINLRSNSSKGRKVKYVHIHEMSEASTGGVGRLEGLHYIYLGR